MFIVPHRSNWKCLEKLSKKISLEFPLNWLTSIALQNLTRTEWYRKKDPEHHFHYMKSLWFYWIGKWVYGKNEPKQIRSLSVERFECVVQMLLFPVSDAYLRLTTEHSLAREEKKVKQERARIFLFTYKLCLLKGTNGSTLPPDWMYKRSRKYFRLISVDVIAISRLRSQYSLAVFKSLLLLLPFIYLDLRSFFRFLILTFYSSPNISKLHEYQSVWYKKRREKKNLTHNFAFVFTFPWFWSRADTVAQKKITSMRYSPCFNIIFFTAQFAFHSS